MTQHSDQTHRRGHQRAQPSSRGWCRRLFRWVGLLGLTALGALPLAAQPAAVPQHWISYAQLVSNQFQAWLSDPDSETVARMHAALQEGLAKRGATVPLTVVARVWVAGNGRVERFEFASLGNPQADADLRAVLTAQSLPEPPPPDMRQPMVLELMLIAAEPI
jgi:hypothetical protein